MGGKLAEGFRQAGAVVGYVVPAVAQLGTTLFGAVRSAASGLASFLPSFADVAGAGRGLFTTLTMGVEGVIEGIRAFPEWFDRAFGSGPATLLGNLGGLIGGFVVGAIDTAGFAIRNMGDLFGLAMIHVGQAVDWLVQSFALIPTNLGRIAAWFGGNWLDMMLAPIRTLGKAIGSLATSFVDFLKNPAGGFSLNLDGIFDEYKKLWAKIDLAQAKPVDIGADVKARQDSMAKMEADYNARLGKAFVPAVAPAIPAGNPAAAATARVQGEAAANKPEVSQELTSFAKSYMDSIKTPGEKFREYLEKSGQALAANLITQDKADKIREAALKDSGFQAVLDSIKTPIQKFADSMIAADEALKAGVINSEQYGMIARKNASETGVNREIKLAGAVELGSREAHSVLSSAMAGRAGGIANVEKYGKQTADELVKLNAQIRKQQAGQRPEVKVVPI